MRKNRTETIEAILAVLYLLLVAVLSVDYFILSMTVEKRTAISDAFLNIASLVIR